jgi:hypothetical protein
VQRGSSEARLPDLQKCSLGRKKLHGCQFSLPRSALGVLYLMTVVEGSLDVPVSSTDLKNSSIC